MLRPFLKSVAFRLYPELWRGSEPLPDPDDEMRAVLEAWAPRDGVSARPS
jgi:hypothetical protein